MIDSRFAFLIFCGLSWGAMACAKAASMQNSQQQHYGILPSLIKQDIFFWSLRKSDGAMSRAPILEQNFTHGSTSLPTTNVDANADITKADYAFAAYQRGYYLTTLNLALRRVEANPNDAAAMTLIGELYYNNMGINNKTTKENIAEAVKWYRLGAEHNNREAQYRLAEMLLHGEGTQQNPIEATYWFQKAANAGHYGAYYYLGNLYLDGTIGTPDPKKAALYYHKAAEVGNGYAAYSLGQIYRYGSDGIAQDLPTSTRWFAEAARQDNIGGVVEYGLALFNGIGIAKDENAGAKLLLKAAYRNNPVAQNRMARVLAAGRGLPKNMIEAMKWHLIAKAAGEKDAWLEEQLLTLSKEQITQVMDAVQKYLDY